MAAQNNGTVKSLLKGPIASLMHTRDRVHERGATVLATDPETLAKAEKLANMLGISEVLCCDGPAEVLDAASRPDRHRVVAGVLELQGANGDMPEKDINGKQTRIFDYLRAMDQASILGKVMLDTPEGVAAMAVVSTPVRDPIIRDVIKEGADPLAMMIARPYETG